MATLSPDEKHAAALRAFEKAECARYLGDGNIHRGLARLFINQRRAEAAVPTATQPQASAAANSSSSLPVAQTGEERSTRRRRRRPKRQTGAAEAAPTTSSVIAANAADKAISERPARAETGDAESALPPDAPALSLLTPLLILPTEAQKEAQQPESMASTLSIIPSPHHSPPPSAIVSEEGRSPPHPIPSAAQPPKRLLAPSSSAHLRPLRRIPRPLKTPRPSTTPPTTLPLSSPFQSPAPPPPVSIATSTLTSGVGTGAPVPCSSAPCGMTQRTPGGLSITPLALSFIPPSRGEDDEVVCTGLNIGKKKGLGHVMSPCWLLWVCQRLFHTIHVLYKHIQS